MKHRLNLRLILVHSIAAWLLAYACDLSRYFRDVPFLKMLIKGDNNLTLQYIKSSNWTTQDFVAYVYFVNGTWMTGLLLAFIISLYVALKHRWWWINSLIAVTLVYIISFTVAHYTHAVPFSTVYNFPFPASIASFISVGILCLIGGALLFFSPKINTLIEKPV